MSTILKALEKHKAEQSGNMPAFIEQRATNASWKIALLTLLLVIIGLLVVVITLLLTPPTATQAAAVVTHIAPEPLIQKVQQTQLPAKERLNTIRTITFEVKPLPKLPAHSEVGERDGALLLTGSMTAKQTQQKIYDAQAEKKALEPKEIDYSDTSSDLQKRFQSALLMSDGPESDSIEPEEIDSGDGRDIQQMASEFQFQVPSMRYDSHIYSSAPKDRWIRINDEDLKEGQFDSSGQIQVLAIQPNRSIFRLGRQSFSLESLTDWKGY